MPTPTWRSRRCCARSGSTGGTPPSPRSRSTARPGCPASTTPSPPMPPTAPSTRSTRASWTRSGSAPTSCSACACRPTRRSTRRSPSRGRSTAPVPRASSTRSCDASVSAVLKEWLDVVTAGSGDPLEALALRTSHPLWVAKALRAALIGHGRATTESVDAEPRPPARVRQRPGQGLPRCSPGSGDRCRAGRRRGSRVDDEPCRRRPARGRPGRHPRDPRGRAAVQDEGPSWSPWASRPREVGQDAMTSERWLPTSVLGPAGRRPWPRSPCSGEPFVANEVNKTRAQLVRQTLTAATAAADAAGSTIEVRHGDGREVGEASPAAYSRILIDAPCTGLGALRRRPEARWRRSPRDVACSRRAAT